MWVSVQGGVLHFCSRRGTDWLIIGDPREERVGRDSGDRHQQMRILVHSEVFKNEMI